MQLITDRYSLIGDVNRFYIVESDTSRHTTWIVDADKYISLASAFVDGYTIFDSLCKTYFDEGE